MTKQTDENGKPLTYWGGLADEAFEKESAINELAEEVYGKGVAPDYEEGFVDGYNKACEKYKYTDEDMIKAIDMARLQGPESFLVKYREEDIIQSLKQPKQ